MVATSPTQEKRRKIFNNCTRKMSHKVLKFYFCVRSLCHEINLFLIFVDEFPSHEALIFRFNIVRWRNYFFFYWQRLLCKISRQPLSTEHLNIRTKASHHRNGVVLPFKIICCVPTEKEELKEKWFEKRTAVKTIMKWNERNIINFQAKWFPFLSNNKKIVSNKQKHNKLDFTRVRKKEWDRTSFYFQCSAA